MRKLFLFLFVGMLLGITITTAQTNPSPFPLGSGNFSFSEWASTSTTGTFPVSMVFHYTNDPGGTTFNPLANGNSDYDCSYTQAARCRFNGIDADGVSVVATSSAQYDNCASGSGASTRFVGATVVALDATARQSLSVTFTGGTVTGGDGVPPREFVLRLQYRYDDGSGFNAWQDVPGPVQYVSNTTGHSEVIGPVALPADLNGKANIQLRWLYYQTALNAGGTRPKLRLDDITITSQPASSEYINVTAISTTPFCISATTSGTGTVNFSAVGTYNTTFRAQLSDETGSFASAQEIGTLAVNGTDPTGTISISIPAGLTSGTGYKIRINADSPAITGFDSAPFEVINGVGVVNNLSASACGSDVDLSWTNPAQCFDELMIVMQENTAFTTTPSGDGTAYTAQLAYGSGTVFENGFVVYKGTTSPQTITAIQSNKHYHIAVFSRRGSDWSTAVTYDFSTTVQPVTALAAVPGDAQADLSWTDPAYCFDEFMIVVKETAAVTITPTGDGSAYTADAVYGNGTAFDGGYVVYKGTVSPQTITGFSNGVTYHASVFTRLGSDWSVAAEVTFIPVGTPALLSYILPRYMEGKTPTNSERVPMAFLATLTNLNPNATYRYFARAVNASDGATAGGAGGSIFPYDTAFVRTTSPSLTTAGEYGEFITTAQGQYTGWFIIEPTGNAKFTPGAFIKPRITINDGNGGTSPAYRFTTTDSVRVLTFGTAVDTLTGTGVVGITPFAPKNFVFLYDNTSATGRPLCGAHVEACGIDFPATTVYAAFYNNVVAGISGNWGGIVPNNNTNGIQAIQELNMNGGVVNTYDESTAVWFGTNTISPTGGIGTPLVIDFSLTTPNHENEVPSFYVFDQILYTGNTAKHVTIVNAIGQVVLDKEISSTTTPLNLKAGTYFIRIQSEHGITMGKFLIF